MARRLPTSLIGCGRLGSLCCWTCLCCVLLASVPSGAAELSGEDDDSAAAAHTKDGAQDQELSRDVARAKEAARRAALRALPASDGSAALEALIQQVSASELFPKKRRARPRPVTARPAASPARSPAAVPAAATTRPAAPAGQPRTQPARPAVAPVPTTQKASPADPTPAAGGAGKVRIAVKTPEASTKPSSALTLAMLKKLSDKVVSNPLALADTLYLSAHLEAAATFYEKALDQVTKPSPTAAQKEGQNDQTRAWILFQLGNCLKATDATAAMGYYVRVLQEHGQTPWTGAAEVQAQLIEWKMTRKPFELLARANKETAGGPDPSATRPAAPKLAAK